MSATIRVKAKTFYSLIQCGRNACIAVIFLIFERPQRVTVVKNSILIVMLGNSIKDSHCSRYKAISLLSFPKDGWISTKFLQHVRYSLSSLETPVMSSVWIRLYKHLRSTHFNLSQILFKKKKSLPLNIEFILIRKFY